MKDINFNKNPFDVNKKLLFHGDRISEYLNTGDTFPVVVEINLTDVCNMKCKYCFCDHRSNFTLDKDIVLKFVKDFKKMGGKAITFSGGGEPTLHKFFKEIVECAVNEGIDLGLITNGTFDEDLVEVIGNSFKWIRISLDTDNDELYREIKRSNKLPVVLRNIKQLKDYKCKVGINCNLSVDMDKETVHSFIDNNIDNVDYIQFRPVLPRFVHKEKIEIDASMWDYLNILKHTDERYMKKVLLSFDKFVDLIEDTGCFPFKSCEGHFLSPILDSNGDLKVCMYHPHNDNFCFGNIYNNSLEEIWKSQKRKDTIEYVRNYNYYENCQMCCKLFEINKFLDYVKNNCSDLDINFL